MATKAPIKSLSLLILAFLTYSSSSIFTKLASMQAPMSLAYIACFAGAIAVLGLYAIIWQKVLTFMPLNKAFLFKSVTLILGLLIAHFIFAEIITLYNIIGAAFIICGLVVLSWKQ